MKSLMSNFFDNGNKENLFDFLNYKPGLFLVVKFFGFITKTQIYYFIIAVIKA